jgi:capsular polysaccharide transport system ATP-binding protein
LKNLIQRPLNALAPLRRSALSLIAAGSAVTARQETEWLPVPRERDSGIGRAIRVNNLVKEYHTPIGRRRILDDITFEVGEGEKVAVLGRNGAGKSTLIKLISGVETPTSGSIEKGMFMSWPLGFAGGLEGEMTGRDNARFIARLYGKDVDDVLAFVDDFAELGRQIDIAVRNYSSGMRMRLAFALTLAVDFECFLIDEVLSVGDQRFHRKCHDALFVQRKHCSMLLISHDAAIVREFCQKAVILKAGRGRVFDDIDLALSIYQTL